MTPKEKAKELFGKYAMYLRANLMYDEEANEDAKQCTLIAVDEIIEANPIAFDENDNCIEKNWWKEVKKEIEKL
jgi:hypothetical protein